MFLKIYYKTQSKKISCKEKYLKVLNLEWLAKIFFGLKDSTQMFFFYKDEDNHKIIVLSDEDLAVMVQTMSGHQFVHLHAQDDLGLL